MEARTAFRGTGISKLFVAAALVVVALGLGVMGAYVAKSISAPAATQTHIVQGLGGAAQDNLAHRSGAQFVDGNAASAGPAAVGPDDRPSNNILSPAYHQTDVRGVIQVGSQSFLGPDALERNSQLTAGMRTTKANGYI